jgi:hypothetical protein
MKRTRRTRKNKKGGGTEEEERLRREKRERRSRRGIPPSFLAAHEPRSPKRLVSSEETRELEPTSPSKRIRAMVTPAEPPDDAEKWLADNPLPDENWAKDFAKQVATRDEENIEYERIKATIDAAKDKGVSKEKLDDANKALRLMGSLRGAARRAASEAAEAAAREPGAFDHPDLRTWKGNFISCIENYLASTGRWDRARIGRLGVSAGAHHELQARSTGRGKPTILFSFEQSVLGEGATPWGKAHFNIFMNDSSVDARGSHVTLYVTRAAGTGQSTIDWHIYRDEQPRGAVASSRARLHDEAGAQDLIDALKHCLNPSTGVGEPPITPEYKNFDKRGRGGPSRGWRGGSKTRKRQRKTKSKHKSKARKSKRVKRKTRKR